MEVTLKQGGNRQRLENRLIRAAEKLGYELRFRRSWRPIRFQIAKRG